MPKKDTQKNGCKNPTPTTADAVGKYDKILRLCSDQFQDIINSRFNRHLVLERRLADLYKVAGAFIHIRLIRSLTCRKP